MLDHLIGRPSPGWKRTQVILIVGSIIAIIKKRQNAPGIVSRLDLLLRSVAPWKIILGTLGATYVLNNLFILLFLNGPEPLSRMYTRNMYRAIWVLTSLDAGFLTALNIKPRFLRNICSFAFSLFYFLVPERADEKVRKYRTVATPEMMRVSWEKSSTPILRFLTYLDRGYLPIRENVVIPRPSSPCPSSFPNRSLGDIKARLYFSGTRDQLKLCRELIVQIPGGGFISMSPKCHDDYVSEWARKTGIPIVSINYGKAPEYPYPWALEECYDAYVSLLESNGGHIGMAGWTSEDQKRNPQIKVIMIGDSAGGNLAAGVVMKCIENQTALPRGLVLIYPCLSFNLKCWMDQEELDLIDSDTQAAQVLQSKKKLNETAPLAVPDAPRRIDILKNMVDRSQSWYRLNILQSKKNDKIVPSNLSMTSRTSYFTDRVIAPEMLRAMALLYLGTSPVEYSFDEDYYLSPIVAPDHILAKFPRTFLICGEKDPLVDDTVIFGARLRKAKEKYEMQRRESERQRSFSNIGQFSPVRAQSPRVHAVDVTFRAREEIFEFVGGSPPSSPRRENGQSRVFNVDDHVRLKILEGITHAFFNMFTILPEAKQAVQLTSEWFLELFDKAADEGEHGLDLVLEGELFKRRLAELANVHLVD